MKPIVIIQEPTTREGLCSHLLDDALVKAVVDCGKRIMALGGELHADEEAMLLDLGSRQQDLWGINLYPGDHSEGWIEFDSMINLRPSQGNRTRGVEDPEVRRTILAIIGELVTDA